MVKPTREMGNRPLITRGLGTTIEGAPQSLDDLTDVDTTTTPPTDGQALVWDDYIGEWVPGDAAAALTVEDGTTSVSPVDTIVFDGATVTDDTGGQVTVEITGGGSSGPSLELDYADQDDQHQRYGDRRGVVRHHRHRQRRSPTTGRPPWSSSSSASPFTPTRVPSAAGFE